MPAQKRQNPFALIIFVVLLVLIGIVQCLATTERISSTMETAGQRKRAVTAPLLADEIDLDTMDGVDQLTRLVLLKTDSLPGKSDRLDARYLNSLMETLYTGLRKPFKSVSADILGIFPTLEFLNISCELTGGKQDNRRVVLPSTTTSDQDRQLGIRRRRALDETTTSPGSSGIRPIKTRIMEGDTITGGQAPPPILDTDNYTNYTILTDVETNNYANHKSSIQVCRAVTSDCLSMNDLVRILPPSITTSNSIVARLCPVILFRLMSNLCRRDTELISAYHSSGSGSAVSSSSSSSQEDVVEPSSHSGANNKESISLNTLQILQNLRNSDEANNNNKRPQKLHKKLKTQTNYQNNVNINTGALKQQRVDEQLLKIKLKLSEPSIEKVWIFSLLFVILSIVVSMGGLIVLPFVKKTTRRRILTLFEGLAVGGLTGSATLHMFPQAFGLVDENYHRYFWRIFVVFLGIYLCYLCERTIKILKVVRAKMRRRSRASLIDMDFRYGFPSISRDVSKDHQHHLYHMGSNSRMMMSNQTDGGGHGGIADMVPGVDRIKSRRMLFKRRPETPEFYELERSDRSSLVKKRLKEAKLRGLVGDGGVESHRGGGGASRSKGGSKKEAIKLSRARGGGDSNRKEGQFVDNDLNNTNNASGCESLALDQSMAPTRQRLIRCLKSVRSQFSPVYVVFNQPTGEIPGSRPGARSSSRHAPEYQMNESHWNNRNQPPASVVHSSRRNRLLENNAQHHHHQQEQPSFRRGSHEGGKVSSKRQAKHEEMETMLYHRNLIEQQSRGETNLNERYQQHRLSDVNDLTEGRQDQDDSARMSVDTVSWMILFGDGLLNVIDGLSIGAAFERNILAGISISVAVMLEEVTHRLGTTAILIRTGFSIKQSFICTFLSACALFPGMIIGIVLSDATDEATPYIFCAAGGIFLYTGLVDVMKEMNRSIENAMRKDIRTTLKIFALQNIGIILAVVFLSFLALYEPDFEEYQKILNNN